MKTKRTRGDSLAKIIADLNPMLRGWFNYFKHAHPNTLSGWMALYARRLRAVLRKAGEATGDGSFVETIISAGPINSSRPRDCSP